MLSNKQAKLITSLQKKKQRDISGLFVIEGDKLVREYLEAGEEVITLAAKAEWISKLPKYLLKKIDNVIEVSSLELKKISSLVTPNNSLALVRKANRDISIERLKGKLTIALDKIQDPGNLGTIIRTAAWFGIKNIVCSNNCVDVYNPKVIQSTMGGLLALNLNYLDLSIFFKEIKNINLDIYAATLDGDSIYDTSLSGEGIILFGNESSGISEELLAFVTKRIMIPSAGKTGPGIESLNVASSVAVLCSEFRRTT